MKQKQLTGKIYWVLDDFNFSGERIFDSEKNVTAHSVTKLKNVVIQDYMIRFLTEDVNDDINYTFSYNVNLEINERGNKFTGFASEVLYPDSRADVSCELFENKAAYFLYGKWMENEQDFTWWARIEK